MFDWDDEELTNIIWGETGESDDHTVPYHDRSEGKAPAYGDNIKKECKVEASDIKPTDQKKPIMKTDLCNNIKLEGSSKHGTGRATITAGCRVESSADMALTNATRTNQDSLGAEASNNLTEVLEHECFRDERNQVGDDSRKFYHQSEDLEQGDFIDYDWANIGSFDDLDRIFSNNDPIFGDTSLPNSHELWSSRKEVTSSPDKFIPLSIGSPSLSLGSRQSQSESLEVKAEYRLEQEKSSGDVENVNDITSNLHVYTDARDLGEDRSMLLLKEKGNRWKRILTGRPKLDQDGELAQLQELCGSLSPQLNKFGKPYVTNQPCLTSKLTQQRQLQGPEQLQHKHFPGPVFASSTYGDMGDQCYPIPVGSRFHSGQASLQCVLSSYKVSPGNSSISLDASSKPFMMTPQEKIEKLRRRQQLRAMLAIQKQQEQFSYQIRSTEQSAKEEGSVEETLSRIPSLEPSSPLEQGDLTVEDSSVEDTILYLLQDVVSKLDLQIRLCIRDSLFRLAQSATERQCGNNSCSTKEIGGEVSEEIINTNNRLANVETETNPIDRAVAHLLFHNPSESTSKLAEIPRSSVSTMLNCERKAIGSVRFSSRFSQQNSETNTITAPRGPEISTSTLRNEVDKLKSRPPCIENSENASNNEGADGSVIGVESASRNHCIVRG